jgi:hypothetical protein
VAAFQQDVRSAFNALAGSMPEDTRKSAKCVRKQINMTNFLGILEKTNILPMDTHSNDTKIQPGPCQPDRTALVATLLVFLWW